MLAFAIATRGFRQQPGAPYRSAGLRMTVYFFDRGLGHVADVLLDRLPRSKLLTASVFAQAAIS